jgi:transcriptional regulator with XRE-family HTH domain
VKKTIGNRIRKLRESKDYSQENMGMELGITAGAYAKIERGESDPSATRLIQIAEILEVDVSVFFHEVTPNKAEDDIKKYGIATQHDIHAIHELINLLKKELESLRAEIKSAKKVNKK